MRLFQTTSLLGFYTEWEERVRPGNPFVIEHVRGEKVYSTEPNWPVIIAVALTVLVVLILGVLLSRYVYASKHYTVVRFAGKTKRIDPKLPLKHALTSSVTGNNWLKSRIADLEKAGLIVDGLYLDAELTVPLDENARVNVPIRIFPKIKQ